jgi:hypothetical protein
MQSPALKNKIIPEEKGDDKSEISILNKNLRKVQEPGSPIKKSPAKDIKSNSKKNSVERKSETLKNLPKEIES